MSEPQKTGMFCDDRTTMDAILEYAIQKGFMTRCGENYHFTEKFKSVDEVIMMAKEEGLVVFYEDNGTCYKLTDKGQDWFRSCKTLRAN